MSNSQDCHNHPELKRKLYSALAESDEGELSVAIPPEVSLKASGTGTLGNVVSEGAFNTSCHPIFRLTLSSRHT
jgi:transcription initiation factor TFIID subunit 2